MYAVCLQSCTISFSQVSNHYGFNVGKIQTCLHIQIYVVFGVNDMSKWNSVHAHFYQNLKGYFATTVLPPGEQGSFSVNCLGQETEIGANQKDWEMG